MGRWHDRASISDQPVHISSKVQRPVFNPGLQLLIITHIQLGLFLLVKSVLTRDFEGHDQRLVTGIEYYSGCRNSFLLTYRVKTHSHQRPFGEIDHYSNRIIHPIQSPLSPPSHSFIACIPNTPRSTTTVSQHTIPIIILHPIAPSPRRQH
jgi:hypothetical protein